MQLIKLSVGGLLVGVMISLAAAVASAQAVKRNPAQLPNDPIGGLIRSLPPPCLVTGHCSEWNCNAQPSWHWCHAVVPTPVSRYRPLK